MLCGSLYVASLDALAEQGRGTRAATVPLEHFQAVDVCESCEWPPRAWVAEEGDLLAVAHVGPELPGSASR